MKELLCFILLYIAGYSAFSCNCKRVDKDVDFLNAKYVFTGTILKSDSFSFEIGHIDYLKGKSTNSLIALIDNCSIYPEVKESWLFYADSIGIGQVYVSQCSWSRKIMNNSISIPPPKMGNTDIYYDWIIGDLYEKNSQNELMSDINLYRFRNVKQELDSLKAELVSFKNTSGNEDIQRNRNYLIFLTMVVIIIIGLYIFNKLYS